MQRREWFKLLSGGLLLSGAHWAQSAPFSTRTIGFLILSAGYEEQWDALVKQLEFYGWKEGTNLKIVYKLVRNNLAAVPQMARELAAVNVDLIAAQSTAGAMMAKNAVDKIPMVGVGMFDPVSAGVVDSLAKPGGRITGSSYLSGDITLKTLEILRLILPKAKQISVIIYDQAVTRQYLVSLFDKNSPLMGIKNINYFLNTVADIDRAFEQMAEAKTDAVVITQHPFFVENRAQLADLGFRHKIPTFAQWSKFVEAGVLASYGNDITASYVDTARIIDKLLRGASPADVPIEQSAVFELAINLRTATKLGITINDELQLRADKLIQ